MNRSIACRTLQLVSYLCIYGMAGVAGGMDRELIDPLPGLAGALFLLLTAVACWQVGKGTKEKQGER